MKTNKNFLFIIFTVVVIFSLESFALSRGRPPAEPTPSQPAPPVTQPPTTGGTDYTNNLKNVFPLWENHTSQGKAWTEFVNRELDLNGQNLLDVIPADQNLFSANYSNLSEQQRKAYWVFLIS